MLKPGGTYSNHWVLKRLNSPQTRHLTGNNSTSFQPQKEWRKQRRTKEVPRYFSPSLFTVRLTTLKTVAQAVQCRADQYKKYDLEKSIVA
jgi:hypothetical protein